MWLVYIIQNVDGRFYTGITNDITRRLRQHNGHIAGGAKATRMGRPWKIVYAEVVANKSIAASRESQIKRLSKTAKLDLLIEHQSALALADMELN